LTIAAMSIEGAKLRPQPEEQYLQYRSLSMSAVVTLALGILSIPAPLVAHRTFGLLLIPLAGMVLGLFSVQKLRRHRNELSGMVAAKLGLALCTVLFLAGTLWGTVSYATEVPEGYQRISFAQLQPDPGYPQLPIPPAAIELNQQKIFIKGYVYPDGQSENIKQFVLVPDMGTCCFGGQPALTDMILVTLREPLRIDYSYYRRNLAGVLHVSPRKKPIENLDGVYYQLDADFAK
jgi:hypothetical protein